MLPLILLHHTHSLENVTKIYSKIVTIILLCPDTDVLSDGECFVEHVSCGGDETFVGCPGCHQGGSSRVVSAGLLDRDLALLEGEPQVTPAIDGLDERRMIF